LASGKRAGLKINLPNNMTRLYLTTAEGSRTRPLRAGCSFRAKRPATRRPKRMKTGRIRAGAVSVNAAPRGLPAYMPSPYMFLPHALGSSRS
jgi:hypothetical protein